MGKEIFFVPIGDTSEPHPNGVCDQARHLRDRLLKERDEQEGVYHIGTCKPLFAGMVWEQPLDFAKPGYVIGGCLVIIEPTKIPVRKRERLVDFEGDEELLEG